MNSSTDLSTLLAAWRGERQQPGPDAAELLLGGIETILAVEACRPSDRTLWWSYLELTREPNFLTALPDDTARRRWATTTFRICEDLNFNLNALLIQRADADPDRILFQELEESGSGRWSYRQVLQRVQSIAATFLTEGRPTPPSLPDQINHDEVRVALLCQNSIASACCDLAALTSDIFVCPLDIHFSVSDLAWIFDRLQITAAVCDNADRLEKLLQVREQCRLPFVIFTLFETSKVGQQDIHLLEQRRARLDSAQVTQILADRPRRTMRDTATIMFTSGSTGRPKGVSFSQHNLITKRFARAAALPEVGRDEVMICYLPLYHTFGRYLEMMGMIFWGGTYVFAGNPSAETLLNNLPIIRPTALISVPIRWVQIRDRVLEKVAESGAAEADYNQVFKDVVGDRLYWGLSAAGYLSPRVFRFFHRQDVALCSGFGMTEGTGGLTMTPPENYVEKSVGLPLPGVEVRFADQGELQIAGPYIARYLPADGPAGDLTCDAQDTDDFWVSTGDLFRQMDNGHLEIIDRIKDIYKNNRGQTVAPRKIEALFTGVPGIKRTFLVGDGRTCNNLLIVPDTNDEVMRSLTSDDERWDYFQRIVTAANPNLAPYERVVNFAVLERDFDAQQGELTPKGSYKRKVIEANFSPIIDSLYQSKEMVFRIGDCQVQIPQWMYRELGVLTTSIQVRDQGLINTETGHRLDVAVLAGDRLRIGDLEYVHDGCRIDLGRLARQPMLWLGNPQVIAFCPCKPGWDTDFKTFNDQVTLPSRATAHQDVIDVATQVPTQFEALNTLCSRALFGHEANALTAITELDDKLGHVGERLGTVIRRRLGALAYHPVLTVRCRAYQVLVLDQPMADNLIHLASFIESGNPFLDETSIKTISRTSVEPRRMQAFRRRLHSYRTELSWPASESSRRLFTDLFRLLADFARYHREFYNTIRQELVCWVLHDQDPYLSQQAGRELDQLSQWLEDQLLQDYAGLDASEWTGKILFQDGLSDLEISQVRTVLEGTTFLRQSVMMAFQGEDLALDDIGPGGIWVSRTVSPFAPPRFRMSINTLSGRHFDLHLVVDPEADRSHLLKSVYWYIALRGHPFGTPMLPGFGCYRPELGAVSTAYVSDLTLWEKVREFSSVRGPGTRPPSRLRWHQLLVRAMSVVVKGWRNSDRRIVPGAVTPNNIIVPEPDFRRGSVLGNLTGWQVYSGPLSLIRPLWRNIYLQALNHYPWCRDYLQSEWIFEAFVEALGVDEARQWLQELQNESDAALAEIGPEFVGALDAFLKRLETRYCEPLGLVCAVDRFEDWQRRQTKASVSAELDLIDELQSLYRLDDLPEIVRYTLYRKTYFRDNDPRQLDIFDRLLTGLFQQPQRRATQRVELSDLQAALHAHEDRIAFNRLAFPLHRQSEAPVVQTVGDPEHRQVIVRSQVRDRHGRIYTMGEPSGPAEVGQLYRLFLEAGFPKHISESDLYFVVNDETEQMVGGIIYRALDETSVFLEGIVVARSLSERELASAILTDFCTRMTAAGNRLIKTHFFLRQFFQKNGFRMDSRWGGLVRFL